MIERYFTIKNFRSIGVDEIQHFDLNYLLNSDDSYGGLVTLIGENNSGKSNVLDAIKAFGKNAFSADDVPFLTLSDGVEPEVGLFLKDHVKNLKVKVKLKGNKSFIDYYENDQQVNYDPIIELTKPSKEFLDYLLSDEIRNKCRTNHRMNEPYNVIEPILKIISNHQLINQNQYKNLNTHIRNPYLSQIISPKFNPNIIDTLIADVKNQFIGEMANILENKMTQEILDKFKVKPVPTVVEYLDTNKIKRADTMSTVSNGAIQKPQFFQKLYELLENENFEELKNAYLKFHQSGMQRKSILTNYSRTVNQSLEKLSNQFNEVYAFNGNKKYSFRLELETNYIYFMISENGEDIFLDSQSTGFKWFFDFFFNVFSDKKIGAGDIVVLDEPATNLHVSGQIELRKQIKDFGMKSGITFVVCTHSPFLIDPDFLDEVRIIKKEGTETKIINKFTMDDKDLDVMMPIKTALTVNRHILMNPDDTLIFVEGVTDYNYLVMGKKILEFDNLTFMPIQGIKRATLDKDLMKIVKFPILLVDSDGAGKHIYEKYKDRKDMEIIRLSDINSSFIEIENLFSEKDKEQLAVSNKDYKVTSALKNSIIQKRRKLTKSTQDNFKLLLNRLTQ